MYTFKLINEEELVTLEEKGSLDVKSPMEMLEEKLSSNNFTMVTRDINSLIENNIDRLPILVVDKLDKTIIDYRDKVRHFDYATRIANDTNGYLEMIKTMPVKCIPKLVVDNTTESKTLEAVRKLGFNKKEKGIYVFKGMLMENMKGFLSPLEQDILYAACNGNIKSGEVHVLINQVFPNLTITGLDKQEAYLYKKLYVENKTLVEVLEEVMRQNGIYDAIVPQKDSDKHEVYNYTDHFTIYNDKGTTDALNIYNYLIEIKKDLIAKIVNTNLSELGVHLYNVTIPEESLRITRVGCEKPIPKNDIYMGSELVHLRPYTYEEEDTHTRTRRGLGVYASRPEKVRY